MHNIIFKPLRNPFLLNGRSLDNLHTLIARGLSTSPAQSQSRTRLSQISITEICGVSSITGAKPLIHSPFFNYSRHLHQSQLRNGTGTKLFQFTSIRHFNTTGGNNNLEGRDDVVLPPLMPFPKIIWPRFINAIRNWFFIHFIIKPYFDKEFSMNEFIRGAKEAVSIVANKLSEGKVEELEGLVDAPALSQIRDSLSKFTVFQQQLLRVATEDVFFAFPYQIGVIIPDENPGDSYPEGASRPPQTRHVEITVCLHVLRGLAEKQRLGDSGASFNLQEFVQDDRNKYNVMICNYRFFKDFTEGSTDPSWIVNMVNHFLPAELHHQ